MNIFQEASRIRKNGESWSSAISRAKNTINQNKFKQKISLSRKNNSRQTNSKITSKICKAGYFHQNATITGKKQKYCRCLMHVSAKNDPSCYRNNKKLGTGGCYLPYSVCAKSVGTTSHCLPSYNFNCIPTNELKAYSKFRELPISGSMSREDVIHVLIKFQMDKTKE